MATAKEPKVSEATQPALFGANQLPDAPGLVAAAKSYAHSGKTASKDEARVEAVLTHYLQTGSLLATARRFEISPNTIKGVLQVWQDVGKLDDLKQRVSGKLGVVAELATDALTEKLLADKIPANVLPIVLGVAVEKKALLDGEATSRVETVRHEPIGFADLAAYLRSKGVEAPAIDVPSVVIPPETQGNG